MPPHNFVSVDLVCCACGHRRRRCLQVERNVPEPIRCTPGGGGGGDPTAIMSPSCSRQCFGFHTDLRLVVDGELRGRMDRHIKADAVVINCRWTRSIPSVDGGRTNGSGWSPPSSEAGSSSLGVSRGSSPGSLLAGLKDRSSRSRCSSPWCRAPSPSRSRHRRCSHLASQPVEKGPTRISNDAGWSRASGQRYRVRRLRGLARGKSALRSEVVPEAASRITCTT